MRRAALFLAVPIAAIACESFGNGETSGGADAGMDGTAAPLSDSASTLPADAGFSCAGATATSCLDFDVTRPDPYPGWFEHHEYNGQMVQLEGNALRSRIAIDAGSSSRIHREVNKSAKRTRISFRVKLDPVTIDPGHQITLVELLCFNESNTGVFDGIVFNVHPNLGSDLVGLGNLTSDGGVVTLVANQWHGIVLEVDWDSVPTAAFFTLDGASGGQKLSPGDCRKADDFTVRLGIGTATGGQAASALYDDVLYEELF